MDYSHDLPVSSNEHSVNVSPVERIASVVAGALLLFTGINRIQRNTSAGAASALTGGYLVYRGASGFCNVYALLGKEEQASAVKDITMHTAVTVNKPRQEVYTFWRRLENLPRFMTHLESVNALDDRRSVWKAPIPGGLGNIEWEAEIVEDRPNELLSWRSLPDSDIENVGKVEFRDAPNGTGTEIHAVIRYHAPGGIVGKGIAQLFTPVFEKMIKNDVWNFKRIIETGEIPTTEGQPSGRNES
ncbi:MAG: SRPBCC family protein [Saprospiraceae bacterium]